MPAQRQMLQLRLLEGAVFALGGDGESVRAAFAVKDPDFCFSWGRKGTRHHRPHHGHSPHILTAACSPQHSNESLQPAPTFLSQSQSSANIRGIHAVFSMSSFSAASNSAYSSPCPSPAPAATNEFSSFPFPPQTSQPKAKKSFSFMPSFRIGSTAVSVVGGSGSSSKGVTAAVPAASLVGTSLSFGSPSGESVRSPPLQPLSHSSHHSSKEPTQQQLQLLHSQPRDLVILSLHTLASLSVPTNNLIPILQQCVLFYLYSDDARVRKEAVVTCCRMLAGSFLPLSPLKGYTATCFRGPSAMAVSSMISRLLEVGVSDISLDVRMAVLTSFSPEFDVLLSREANVATLLLLLADEAFAMKLEVISLLGRTASLNPAAVLPPMRLQLIRVITELRNFPDQRFKEQATLLLCRLLQFPALHPIFPPFAPTLVSTLLPLQLPRNVIYTAEKVLPDG